MHKDNTWQRYKQLSQWLKSHNTWWLQTNTPLLQIGRKPSTSPGEQLLFIFILLLLKFSPLAKITTKDVHTILNNNCMISVPRSSTNNINRRWNTVAPLKFKLALTLLNSVWKSSHRTRKRPGLDWTWTTQDWKSQNHTGLQLQSGPWSFAILKISDCTKTSLDWSRPVFVVGIFY